MKVHLIKKQTIIDYAKTHANSIAAFSEWINKIKYADWDKPTDIQNTFNTADILGKSSNRVVFNIAGNNHRLICKIHFGANNAHLFVCWIGTHADYDKICDKNEQFTISVY